MIILNSYKFSILVSILSLGFSFIANASCNNIQSFYDSSDTATQGSNCTVYAQIQSPTKNETITVLAKTYDNEDKLMYTKAVSDGKNQMIGSDQEYLQVCRYHPKGSYNSTPMKTIPLVLHVNVKAADGKKDLYGDLQIFLKDDYDVTDDESNYWTEKLGNFSLYISWNPYGKDNKSLFKLITSGQGGKMITYKLTDNQNSSNIFYVSLDSQFAKGVSYAGFTSEVLTK